VPHQMFRLARLHAVGRDVSCRLRGGLPSTETCCWAFPRHVGSWAQPRPAVGREQVWGLNSLRRSALQVRYFVVARFLTPCCYCLPALPGI
jgi:hypothetical protein